MLIIGLTGGIGSGKSTVSNIFQDLGVPIIDTDQIARDLVTPTHTEKSQDNLQKITKHFGPEVLTHNQLNRQALRKRIFTSPTDKKWIEGLLHPQIRQAVQQQIQTLTAPYCIIVIPLLLNKEQYPYLNRILVVDTSEEQQIERSCKRDGSTPSKIKTIMETQIARKDRLKLADDVITNNNIGAVKQQVQKLHLNYLK